MQIPPQWMMRREKPCEADATSRGSRGLVPRRPLSSIGRAATSAARQLAWRAGHTAVRVRRRLPNQPRPRPSAARSSVPMSQQSFADLGVSRAVAGALAERGITEPFAIQQLVIADILAGHDVLAKSPTGSGKTIAFGAPIADRIEANDRRPAALVLAPTRDLASQIVEDIRPLAHARALRIAAVYGGVGIVKQAREAARAHIVVATPGPPGAPLPRGDLALAPRPAP